MLRFLVLAAFLLAVPVAASAQSYGTVPTPVMQGSQMQTITQGQQKPEKPADEKPAAPKPADEKPAAPAK